MNKKAVIALISTLIIAVGTGVGIYLVTQTQILSPSASVADGSVDASLGTPSPSSLAPGGESTIELFINTNNTVITDAILTLEINSNPAGAITVTSVNPNPQLVTQQWRFTQPTYSDQQIKITAFDTSLDGFSSTTNVLFATITVKGAIAGTADFSFNAQNSIIHSKSSAEDVLSVPAGVAAKITVGSGGSTPPSPTVAPPTSAPTSPTASPTTKPPTPPTQATPTPTTSDTNDDYTYIRITNVSDGDILTDTTPTFQGVAEPNSDIEIEFTTDDIYGTTTSDTSGNWSWTTPVTLSGGSHTAIFTATDADSVTSSSTLQFTISTSTGDTSLPEAGNLEITLLIVSFGIFLILAGSGIAILK